MAARIRIGTRGSRLALVQANAMRAALIAADGTLAAEGAVELVPIRTSGDKTDRPLADEGGKGLFVKELDEAVLDGRADLAVHSLKDVPAERPEGLVLAGVLAREDPRDALIARAATSIATLPEGATVGTSSPRRRALLLSTRPDLRMVEFRGNVETRLAKLAAGEVDATILAVAGLRRLGRADAMTCVLEPDELLPAACQGAIGAECRADDAGLRDLLAQASHAETVTRVTAERAALTILGGTCVTPVAVLASLDGDELAVRGQIVLPDGSKFVELRAQGPAAEAERLGAMVGAALRRRAPPGFFGT